MAKINGTNGDDTLTGGEGDDYDLLGAGSVSHVSLPWYRERAAGRPSRRGCTVLTSLGGVSTDRRA